MYILCYKQVMHPVPRKINKQQMSTQAYQYYHSSKKLYNYLKIQITSKISQGGTPSLVVLTLFFFLPYEIRSKLSNCLLRTPNANNTSPQAKPNI